MNAPARELRQSLAQPEGDAPHPRDLSETAIAFFARHEELRGVPAAAIRKAWFAKAHLLLSPGATLVDMGSADGAMAFAMAALSPELNIIGVDNDKRSVNRASERYRLPNLEYRIDDITKCTSFAPQSIDAIVNCFTMHEIFSGSKFHERAVIAALDEQLTILKNDGQMFLWAYPQPSHDDMLLMEMPEPKTRLGNDIATMSEPDLLVWYAERALTRDEPGYHGFFLEELPPRFPGTRLFRLPYKWAYEFIIRKDDRKRFERDVGKEYTFFTKHDFRKALRATGARVVYSSPCWNENIMRTQFEGHFRFYSDDGAPLGMPATSFVAVARKVDEKASLKILERRPSSRPDNGALRISAMRNERTGQLVDVVSRDFSMTHILPYRFNGAGGVNVFLHEGLPRGIVNTVERTGKNIDEKHWSGHMVEAVAVNTEHVTALRPDDLRDIAHFARDILGMRPAVGAMLEPGPNLYPAPDFIEEVIATRYLKIDSVIEGTQPRSAPDSEGFKTRGQVCELDAQAVLDAIAVGMVPNAALEIQLTTLLDRLGVSYHTWQDSPITLETSPGPLPAFDPKAFAAQAAGEDQGFKPTRGSAGKLRTLQSIFVDEGWIDGGMAGLSAHDMQFVMSEETTANKAVVLPLTRNAQGTVMAGITTEFLPVPQRFQGNGTTIRAPSFDLPRDVTTLEQARKWVAEKFGVEVKNVFKLGESYFLHPSMTPQRVFPFAVAAPKSPEKMLGGAVQFFPLKGLINIHARLMWNWSMDLSTNWAIMKSYHHMAYGNEQELKLDVGRKTFYEMTQPGAEKFEDMTGLATPAADRAPEPLPENGAEAAAQDAADTGGGGDKAAGDQPAAIAATAEAPAQQPAPAVMADGMTKTWTRKGKGANGNRARRAMADKVEAARSETARSETARSETARAETTRVETTRAALSRSGLTGQFGADIVSGASEYSIAAPPRPYAPAIPEKSNG